MGRVRLPRPHRVHAKFSPSPPSPSLPSSRCYSYYLIPALASPCLTLATTIHTYYYSISEHPEIHTPVLVGSSPLFSPHRAEAELSSSKQGDEHLEPADQPWRPPGVPGGKGERPADAVVRPLRRPVDAAEHGGRRGAGARRAVPAVAGADAAPAKQLRRRRARRGGGRRCRTGAVPAADARLPAVAPGQERRRGGRPGRRRAAAAAAAARAAGGGVVRRGARRAPDRAHRPQDAPDHRVPEPDHRERRRPVADRRLRRLLRPRRVPRHRPQRQGQARHAQEPRRLLRPEHRPPAPLSHSCISP